MLFISDRIYIDIRWSCSDARVILTTGFLSYEIKTKFGAFSVVWRGRFTLNCAPSPPTILAVF